VHIRACRLSDNLRLKMLKCLWLILFSFLSAGEACTKRYEKGDCWGTAPNCGANAGACINGEEFDGYVDSCGGDSACWTGQKVQCKKLVICTSCPKQGTFLSDGNCEPCAVCGGSRILVNCGGSSPGQCTSSECVDADYKYCPSGASEPCIFEKETITIKKSSASKTETKQWEVSGQVAGAPPSVKTTVAEANLGTTVGGSTSTTHSIEVTDQVTGKTFIALSPGWVFCFYSEVKVQSNGPPTCYLPKFFEVELISASGKAVDICGGEMSGKVACPSMHSCSATVNGARALAFDKLLVGCCLAAVLLTLF